jgi:hypothetical protein
MWPQRDAATASARHMPQQLEGFALMPAALLVYNWALFLTEY